MSDRTPDQLAREVREVLDGAHATGGIAEAKRIVADARAALAELEALASELAEALAFVMKEYNVPNAALTREQSAALAAAAPSPGKREPLVVCRCGKILGTFDCPTCGDGYDKRRAAAAPSPADQEEA